VESSAVVSGLRLVAIPESRPQLLFHLRAWVDGIRRSPGCMKVTLAEQEGNPNILYAVAEWEDERALEDFRASTLAKDLARPLVALMAEKPQTIRFAASEVATEEINL